MKTIDIFRAVMSKKYAIEILKELNKGDQTFTGLKDAISAEHNSQVDRVLKFLIRFALVSHIIQSVAPTEISFYRINQRGKDILKLYVMMEEADEKAEGIPLSAK
jgi:DNA-binding HxlR family transcriptional regulator